MDMQESFVNESPRRRIARRVGAAGMALAPVLMLTACHEAYGGGYIDDPLPSGVLPVDLPVGAYTGEANFGFNFSCDMNERTKRAVIKGEITYHDSGTSIIEVPVDPDLPGGLTEPTDFPEIRIHGTVDPFVIDGVSTCAEATGIPVARFEGTYRSQDAEDAQDGRFNVAVGDQREPGRSLGDGDINGDGFSIELTGDPVDSYAGYTRAGYIEGGNIQVDQ
jgi:hypothetical protein